MNKCEVLLYTSYLHIIGGIETFMINFIDLMKDDYEIAVYCPRLPREMSERISKRVKLYTNEKVTCEILVMVRMMDEIPANIIFEKSIRMCHATKSKPSWKILDDCDKVINVSKASKTTFESKGEVIYNPLHKSPKNSLIFVSATRIPALDKGRNAERMLSLANMLNKADITFLWLNFSDAPLNNAPKGFINVGTYQDIQPYIKRADYVVQLSDQEGFGYSVLEGLINNVPVIVTPFDTTKELGVIDGENGYIIPFDLNFDVRKLLNVPVFEYTWDNDSIKNQWANVFKTTVPRKKNYIKVECVRPYKDLQFNKMMEVGQTFEVTEYRYRQIERFCRRIGV